MDRLKRYLIVFVFFLGIILSQFISLLSPKIISYVFAHGGDTSLNHSCYNNSTGALKIVGENDSCAGGETALDWNKNTYLGLPFICINCNLFRYADKFTGKDLSNAELSGTTFAGPDNIGSANLQGIILSGAILNSANFNGADLTNADFSDLHTTTETPGGYSASFDSTDLTNADLSGSNFNLSNFDNSTIDSTDFTDADLTGAHFVGATLTSVVWDNTICPDGTNSDSHGNTCAGYLTP